MGGAALEGSGSCFSDKNIFEPPFIEEPEMLWLQIEEIFPNILFISETQPLLWLYNFGSSSKCNQNIPCFSQLLELHVAVLATLYEVDIGSVPVILQ